MCLHATCLHLSHHPTIVLILHLPKKTNIHTLSLLSLSIRLLFSNCRERERERELPRERKEMERGGGFHGYHRLPIHPTSGIQQPDMKLKLPEITNNNNNTSTDDNECTVREQDRFMPIANVIRIMRKILPPHAKISDDAKETIQECVSEYISFVTGEANDRCQREQRKTITAEDVLWAMSKLGFDDYIEPLTVYLHRYREFDGGERGSIRGEPLVKRSADHGAFGMGAYVHGFHHNGFFGPASIGGFFKDPAGGAAAGPAAVAGFEPYAQCKE